MSHDNPADTTRGPLEKARTPDAPKVPGESAEKRDRRKREGQKR